jgi:hypothetical protein
MANVDFDFDEPKKKSEDPTVESLLEKGYRANGSWWMWTPGTNECPNKSIFPDENEPYWKMGDIPQKIQEQYADGDPCVQGWKLHLAVNKEDIENLVPVVSPLLKSLGVMHKFSEVEDYKKYDDGKACAIYPVSPTQLDKIVRKLDVAIGVYNMAANMTHKEAAKMTHKKEEEKKGRWVTNNSNNDHKIRRHGSGVRGDLALGNTGVIYCRYGAFTGGLGDDKKLYNPLKDDVCADLRGEVPYPEFIKTVPDEIARHIATTSRWRPIISAHRPNDGASKSNGGKSSGVTGTGSKSNGVTGTGPPWTAARHR